MQYLLKRDDTVKPECTLQDVSLIDVNHLAIYCSYKHFINLLRPMLDSIIKDKYS